MNKNINTNRHSLSHILALSVKELYPNTKLGIGPAIENGFYYDFDNLKIEGKDLEKIEKRMREIIKKGLIFEKENITSKKAKALFKEEGYKMDLLKDLKNPTIYKLGSLTDLCKGPHIKTTKDINAKAFRLEKTSGAYWKGDEKNKMLTRIYGLAFETEKELKDYLTKQEEAEKRDHRKIGQKLDLFITSPTVGMGLVMWLPKGAMIWRTMEDFWYQEHLKNGYELVRTPHIGSRSLWEQSGHWGFYNESMYPPIEISQTLKESQEGKKPKNKEEYLLKPMNCPFHVVLYNAKPRTYKELPLRWAECGTVYRYEKSGELSGLTRVRGFTQDDAHIICTREQVKKELKKVADFILFILKTFGFKDFNVYLSVRDPKDKKKYAGNDKGWDFTENILEEVAKEQGLHYIKEKGEAAFYGPKLDYKIKDCLNREWQCSTLQFDFNLPERFNMNFINKKGEKERPFVLHRALFGSFERFIGMLLEHYEGALPLWLSPVQVIVLSIGSDHNQYAKEIEKELKDNNIRTIINIESETVGNKIRKAEQEKIPLILVVGDKEIKTHSISLRSKNKNLGTIKTKDFIMQTKKDIENKK